MVLRQTLVRASMGLLAGLILSAAVTRLLTTMIHGVTPLDPITYLSVAVLLLAVVLAASYFPARRASKTDPLSALRDA
jgi:ABC-type antimicrobial peptide transport system permease subunit